jgi:ABC-type glycerol-3-phosphate transport system substrate-binding protein
MIRKKSGILLMMFLVFGLFACSKSRGSGASSSSAADAKATGGKTKISILRPGDQEKVELFMKPSIEKFMANNPDIEVEIIYDSWGGWQQKFPSMFQSGSQPDVVFWWENKQNDASVKGKLVDLKNLVDKKVFDDIPQSAWNLTSLGGDAVYYVPSSVDVFVLFYNKDVFRQAGLDPNNPPKTWDELLAACQAIASKTKITPMGVPAKSNLEALHEFFAHFITQNTGTDMLDQNNNPTYNNAQGLGALEFIGKLIPYVIPSPTDYSRGELRPLLRDGQVGILVDSAWAIPTYTGKFGDNLDDSPVGIAGMPVGPNNQKIAWAGTNGWIATRQSTAEASAKLISWVMSDEMLMEHHKAYGSIPMTKYELAQDFYKYNYWKTMSAALSDYKLIGMIGKHHATPAAFYSEYEPLEQLFLDRQMNAAQTLDGLVKATEKVNARQR